MQISHLFESKLPLSSCLVIHLFAMLVLLVFGSGHFFFDSLSIGIACFGLFVVASFSFLSLLNNVYTEFFGTLFVVSAAAMLVYVSYLYGYRGLLYCFALPAALFLIMDFRLAFVGGLLFCILNLWAASYSMDSFMLWRFAIALSLSFVFSSVISHTLFEQQKKFEKEANEDYLTGLMNQRSFYTWLSAYLKDPKSLGTKITLYYFDIDDFKSINDAFGHEGGDRVLKEFCRRVQIVLDEHEEVVAEPNLRFCRLSGDEFALARIATDTLESAEQLAGAIQAKLSQPFYIGERVLQINSSIGVHHFCLSNQDLSYVMRSADLAMYKAKHSGKHQFYLSEGSPA